jgi:hypothetical protein
MGEAGQAGDGGRREVVDLVIGDREVSPQRRELGGGRKEIVDRRMELLGRNLERLERLDGRVVGRDGIADPESLEEDQP